MKRFQIKKILFILFILFIFIAFSQNLFAQAANAGTDQVNCENYTDLEGNNPGGGVGTWTVNVGFGTGNFANANQYDTHVTEVGWGQNKYTWTVLKNGSTTTDDVIISNWSAYAGADQTVCVDNTTLAAGNPANLIGLFPAATATGIWTTASGATITNNTLFNTTVSGLSVGPNVFIWTLTQGGVGEPCPGAATFDEVVIFNSATSPIQYNVSGTGNICPGGYTDVLTDGSEVGVDYELVKDGIPTGIIVIGDGNGLIWSVNTAGIYTVEADMGAGCSAVMVGSAVITLISLNDYTLSAVGNDYYCTGSSGVTLELSGSDVGVDYQMIRYGLPYGAQVAGTGAAIQWTNIIFGDYTVDAIGTCTQPMSGAVNVLEKALPLDNLVVSDGSVCSNSAINFTVGLTEIAVNYEVFLGAASVAGPTGGNGGDVTFSVTPVTPGINNYIVKATSSFGCLSTLTDMAVIDALPLPNSGLNISDPSICSGAQASIVLSSSEATTSYQLRLDNGTNNPVGAAQVGPGDLTYTSPVLTADTDYNILATKTDGSGCAVEIVNRAIVTVNPNPATKTVTTTNYCSGAAGGTLTVISSDATVDYILTNFTTTTTLTTIPGTGGDITWVNLTAADYYITATDQTTNCLVNYANVTIIENPLPTFIPSVEADDYTLCSGISTQLHANANSAVGISSYVWDNGLTLDFDDIEEPNASPLNNTTYTVTVVDNNGCEASQGVSITVKNSPNVNISPAGGGGFVVCEGGSISLKGESNKITQSWSWDGGVFSGLGEPLDYTFAPGSTTDVTLEVVDIDGCVGMATETIIVNITPTANAGADVDMCDGIGTTLDGGLSTSGGATFITAYEWYNIGNGVTQNVTPAITTEYKLIVTNDVACTDTSTVTVTVLNNPTVSVSSIPASGTICDGESIDLTATPAGGSGSYTNYSWLPGSMSFQTVTVSPPNGILGNGPVTQDYTVEVTDNKTCKGIGQITITTFAKSDVSIDNDGDQYCEDEGLVDLTGLPAGTFPDAVWTSTTGGLIINDDQFNTVGRGGTVHNITYTYTNGWGCTNDVTGSIEILPYATPTLSIDNPADGATFCNVGELLVSVTTTTDVSGVGVTQTITGPGITPTGIGTADFDPNDGTGAGIGTHTITYTVTTPGCSNSTSITVDVGNPVAITPLNDMCVGDADQVLVVDVGGGTWDITFTPTATGIPITVSYPEGHALAKLDADEPGVYDVDYNLTVAACTNTTTVSCTVNAIPTVDFDIGTFNQSDLDINFCDNIVSVNLTPMPGGGSFSSTPAGNVNTLTFEPEVVGAGLYTITYTYTDGNGCSNFVTSNNVQVNAAPVVNITNLNAGYCMSDGVTTIIGDPKDNGSGTFGTWTVPAFWQVAPIAFVDNGDGTADFTPTEIGSAGTYTIEYSVTAANGCSDVATQLVDIYALPTVEFTGLPATICQNEPPVVLTGNQSGGLFAGTGTTGTALDLVAGKDTTGFNPAGLNGNFNITYTYTDGNGCEDSDMHTVSVTDPPVKYSVNGGGNYCEGLGGLVVGLSGAEVGIDYELYRNGNPTGNIVTPAVTGAFDFGSQLLEGTYTVEARAATCSEWMNGNAVVNVDSLPDDATGIIALETNVCPDGTTIYTFEVADIEYAASYQWSVGSAIIQSDAGTKQITVTYPIGSVAGTEIISVYGHNACGDGAVSTIDVEILNVPAVVGVPVISGDDVVCEGETGKMYSINVADFDFETSFEWETTSGIIMTDSTSSSVTIDFAAGDPLSISGTVRVRAVNACGATDWVDLDITVNPIPDVDISPLGAGELINCAPASQVQLTANTTENPADITAWLWTASNGGVIFPGDEIVQDARVTHEGNFEVQIEVTTNGLACYSTDTITVGADKDAPIVSIDAPDIITCADTSVTLQGNSDAANSDYNWTFTPPANIVGTTNTDQPVVNRPGTYTLTVTNIDNQCTLTVSANVYENDTVPNISVTTIATNEITCLVNSVLVEGNSTTTGAEYKWTTAIPGAIIDFDENNTTNVNKAGDYLLTITDPANGCTSFLTVTVNADTIAPNITSVINNDVPNELTCYNTSVQLEAQAVADPTTTFGWTTNTGTIDFSSGVYGQFAEVSDTGDYYVVATNPNGCESEPDTISVTEDKRTPGINILPADTITCTDTTVTLDASGSLNATNYTWVASLGGHILSDENTATPTVDAAGRYTVTAEHDATGCPASDFVDVVENDSVPFINIFDPFPNTLTCNTTSVMLSADATALTTNKLIEWATTDGHFTSATDITNPTVDSSGTYVVTITNTNSNCSAVRGVTVNQNITPPTIGFETPLDLTCSRTQVILTANATSVDSSPLTYVWVEGAGGNIVSGDATATPVVDAVADYTLTVKDQGNGCINSSSVSVSIDTTKADVSVNTNPNPITCDNSTVILNGLSTYPNKSYQWTTTGSGVILNDTTETPIVNAEGTYNLIVENLDNNCKVTSEDVIVVKDVETPNVTVNPPSGDLTCNVTEVTISVSHDVDYSYAWSGTGNTTPPNSYTTNVDAAGPYTVIVENIYNGCDTSYTVNVAEDKIPVASPVINNTETCYGTANPAFIKISGDNIKWYSDVALINQIFAGDSYTPGVTTVGMHTYYATSTGTNGCESFSKEITLTIDTLPEPPFTTGNAICEGGAVKTISAVGPNINWYDNIGTHLVGGSTYTPAVTADGIYTYYATTTDVNGCESGQTATTYIINEVPTPPSFVNSALEVCETETNPVFTVVGDNIQWYKNIAGSVISTGNSHQPDETLPGTYTYYATQTVNSCESAEDSAILTIHPMPEKYSVTGGGSYCESTSGVPVGLSNSENNVNYELWLDETSMIADVSGTLAAISFGNQTTAGNYTVYAKNTTTLCRRKMNGGVDVVVNPLPGDAGSITGSATVCQTETGVTYTIDPVSDATSYVWTVPTGFNIVSGDNSNSITVDIDNTAADSSISVYAKNTCGDGNVSPNLFITVNPIPEAAGAISGDANICNDEDGVVYSIAAVNNATSYNWELPQGATVVAGPNSRQITLDFDNTAVNDVIRVAAVNSCGEGTSSSLDITVANLPYVNAGDQQDLCSSTTVLEGNTPTAGSGIWTTYSGAVTNSDPTNPTATITSIGEGINRLVWTVTANGCSLSDTVVITNNQVIVEAGNNQTICTDSIVLAGSTVPIGAIGSWSAITGSASFTDGNNPNTTATEFASGINILKWAVTKGGCTNYDSVIVDNQRPTQAYAGIDQAICKDSTVLGGNLPTIGKGLWTPIVGAANFDNDTIYNTKVTGLSKGVNTLRWTISNGICNTIDEVTITNNQLNVNAGVDQVICSNTTILDAIDPPSGEGYWAVDTGSATFMEPNEYNTMVVNLAQGLNVLTWNVNNNNCISSDTVSIINDSPTDADAGTDTTISVDFITLQGNIPSKGIGEWQLISGSAVIVDRLEYNTSVTNLAFGENTFRWTITNNSCISTDDVVINNATPTNISAGADQTICGDFTDLEGSIPPYGLGQWSVLKGSAIFSDPNNRITNVTGLAKGENVLQWSIWQNGWTSDSLVISNDSPTDANAGTNQILCVDSVSLFANEPIIGFGKWTIISGSGQFENDTIYNTKVTNLAQGENIYKWTITNKSCSSSNQVSITNNSPTSAYAGLNQTICTNTLTLNPNTPSIGTGEWNIVSGAGNFNDNVVTYLAPDTNILRWTIVNNACSSYDEIIIVNNEPSNANAGTHKIICTDSINLAASTPIYGNGIWTIQSGSADIESNITATTKVTNLNQGINKFRWTVTYNGCTKVDEVNIHNAFVEATAGLDQEMCSEFTDLDANNPEAGTGMWSVLGGSGSAIFDNAGMNDTYVSGLDQGDNILRWTITNEICISSDDVVITNNLPTDAFAGPDQSLCVNNAVLQGNVPFKGDGEWSVLSGSANIADSSSATSSVTNLSYGVNTLRWTITNGSCISTDEVKISNNSTETSNAGVEQFICTDSTILYANEPAFGIGQWSVISGAATFADNNKYNTKIKDLGKGVNILKWVISNGQCSSSSEVTVSNNSPTKAIAGADQTTCGDHTFLQANIPVYGTGQWNLVSGAANFAEDTAYNTEVTGLNPGENTMRWTITNAGCESTDDVIIFNDLPYESDAGADFEICGTTTSLYANDPLTGDGEWIVISGSATFDDPYRFDADVSALGFGANTLRWTITYDACTTYDEIIVTNNKIEVYAGIDQTISESSTLLAASNPSTGSGQWTAIGGAGVFADASNAITMVSNLSSGLNTFRWAVDVNGCISYDDVSVTYNVPPDASFVITTSEGCPPLEVYFVNNSLNDLPFTWDFDDGETSDHVTIKHTYSESGVYNPSLTVIGKNGEVVVRDTIITVFNQPEAAFLIVNRQVYIPEEEAIFINTSIDAAISQWDFGDGGTSTDNDPKYVYDTEGIYDIVLQVWSENNCYDSTIVVGGVEVIESGTVIFPTAFTPNLDGSSGGAYNPLDFTNDVFYPIGEGLEDYHLEIFNRWGVFVFESYDIKIGWDGYYDNKLLNEGVYVWKVTGKYNNGKDFKKVGTVLLLR